MSPIQFQKYKLVLALTLTTLSHSNLLSNGDFSAVTCPFPDTRQQPVVQICPIAFDLEGSEPEVIALNYTTEQVAQNLVNDWEIITPSQLQIDNTTNVEQTGQNSALRMTRNTSLISNQGTATQTISRLEMGRYSLTFRYNLPASTSLFQFNLGDRILDLSTSLISQAGQTAYERTVEFEILETLTNVDFVITLLVDGQYEILLVELLLLESYADSSRSAECTQVIDEKCQGCHVGYWLNYQLNKCVKTITYCSSYDDSDQCQQCILGRVLIGQTCLPEIFACAVYDSTGLYLCQQCIEGFQLNGLTCQRIPIVEETCEEGSAFDTNGDCQVIGGDSCEYLDVDSICQVCAEGLSYSEESGQCQLACVPDTEEFIYIIHQSKCVEVDANCQRYLLPSGMCIACKLRHYFYRGKCYFYDQNNLEVNQSP